MSEDGAGRKPPLNSLPGNLLSSIYPEGRSTFPARMATSRQKIAYVCLCKAMERYRQIWGTGIFVSGVQDYSYARRHSTSLQEDKRVHHGFIKGSLRRLLTPLLHSFGTREI